MRIRLYLRRSHADAKRGVSIELQRQACADAATRLGGTITGEYVDDDKSAFRDDITNRTGMQQALAEARHYDVLMLYKYDRLARDEAVFFDLLRQFERHRVSVKSATEGSDPLGRALSGVLAAEYSRVLSMRMRDVRRYEAQQGRIVGAVPLGYTRVNGIGVLNDDAERVREAGELYATGEWGVQRLAVHLGLNPAQLKEMLANPVYAGYAVCAGELFPGKHPALWDAALWQRIQTVREHRSKQRTRYAPKHDPLLAGMARCAACGAPMWHQSSNGQLYYECSTVRSGRVAPTHGVCCTRNNVSAAIVEQLALGWIVALSTIADLPSLAAAQLESRPVAKRHDPSEQLRRLARAYADGGLSDSEYERRRAALLATPTLDEGPAAVDPSAVLAVLRDIPTLIAAATNGERRIILRAFVSEVWMRRNRIVALRPTNDGAPLLHAALASGAWMFTSLGDGEPGGGLPFIRHFALTAPALLAA